MKYYICLLCALGISAYWITSTENDLSQETTSLVAQNQQNAVNLSKQSSQTSDLASTSPQQNDTELNQQSLEVQEGSQATNHSMFSAWLTERGYADIESFIFAESPDDIKANFNIQSDYAAYDLNTLKSLAESGDNRAKLIYALNLETPAETIPLFESALVSGSYHAAIHQIAFAYDLLSYNETGVPLMEKVVNQSYILSDNDKEYLAWLAVGQQLNDPMSAVVGEVTALGNLIRSLEIKQLAAEKIARLNEKRSALGLTPIETLTQSPELTARFNDLYIEKETTESDS